MSNHTLDEIRSQPQVWRSVGRQIAENKADLTTLVQGYGEKELVFVGSGTSYYLALSAAGTYAGLTGLPARAVPSCDVLAYAEAIFPKGSDGHEAVVISRSGTTTEALLACEAIRDKVGFQPTTISCRPDSGLTRLGRYSMVIPEADEQSVVMTRSFTSMLLMLQHLAALKAGHRAVLDELAGLPEKVAGVLENHQNLVEQIIGPAQFDHFVYLGLGPYYGLACEGMLKIKEMSISHSEAYHTLEYRHGPMSLVTEKTLLVLLMSERMRREETRLAKDMQALGARILVICDRADAGINEAADHVVELGAGLSDYTRSVLYMPILQLLGYYQALAKGFDPDHPKNLTQVVTL